MLSDIERVLPAKSNVPRALTQFVKQHAEWKIPIVMLILSVFTLFPLLVTLAFGGTGGGPFMFMGGGGGGAGVTQVMISR